jgi:hypothetical protein
VNQLSYIVQSLLGKIEAEIDARVKGLYGLSEDEISIVEGKA